MARLFKNKVKRNGRTIIYPNWYGRIRLGDQIRDGKKRTIWRKVRLFTDRRASETRLAELQREADQRAAGVLTREMDHAGKSIAEHVADYYAALESRRIGDASLKMARFQLDRLVEQTGWQRVTDLTDDSLRGFLKGMDQQTAAYKNTFVKRAKAFANWMVETGRLGFSPFKPVKRINERGARRTRARRAATVDELAALFASELPDYRRLAYALAAYNGLRRNEVEALTWDRLHLSAPIPFVELPQKCGTDDTLDSIPLHPYCVDLLERQTAGIGTRVLPNVPDVATLKKEWTRAGVNFADSHNRRLDFHALRHTFQTNLDRAGASRATKKKLMRHAADDVTDGYAHAELAEMIAALQRIPSPTDEQTEAVAKTGTDDGVAGRIRWTHIGHGQHMTTHDNAPVCNDSDKLTGTGNSAATAVSSSSDNGLRTTMQAGAGQCSENEHNPLKTQNLRPDTQVD